ncbi:MAG: transcriptional repressor LexA [Proteobacteria bacterium]|nr:transcriptional repressor LexA [Pseudomonadota bacterium]
MYSENRLTPRQTEVINFICEFQSKERMAPTYREIANHFRFKSTKAAADHVLALEKKGYLRRHTGRSRGIELTASVKRTGQETITVPIIGDIPAGTPEQKIEFQSGTISVDSTILDGIGHHRLFALKVKGDSMIGRGIYDGDWVIADADATPNENDVVVALIDGENTLKALALKENNFYLRVENPDYNDWVPVNELIIQGTAKALIRRI